MMKTYTLVITSFLLATAFCQAELTPLDSSIKEVTVYGDRAQVVRFAETNLGVGTYTLVFSELPARLDRDGLQAKGMGHAKIHDLKYQKRHIIETANDQKKALEQELESLQVELNKLGLQQERVQKRRQFLDAMMQHLATPSGEGGHTEFSPDKWQGLLSFQQAEWTEADQDQLEINRVRSELTKKIDKVKRELSELGQDNSRWVHEVHIPIEVTQEGPLQLELRYLVYGPSWRPTYDARIDSETKTLGLDYYGLVQQNTGEDWHQARIRLSTAQPQLGGKQPELNPWRVYLQGPPPSKYNRSARLSRFESSEDQVMAFGNIAAPAPASLDEIKTEYSQVAQTGYSATTFEISSRIDIPSDNQPHRTAIAGLEFPCRFQYSTVPKISPFAYLKAEVENKSDTPLLPGTMSLFKDGEFVGKSALERVNPEETFWASLGVDERIKVEHTFIRKYQEDKGVLAKKNRITYEYEITLENNTGREETVQVLDQLPISTHEDISIIPVKPKLKKDNERVKKDNESQVEWNYTLAPGEKVVIPFVFSVEYPEGETLRGL